MIKKACIGCGDNFLIPVQKRKAKFCSRECYYRFKRKKSFKKRIKKDPKNHILITLIAIFLTGFLLIFMHYGGNIL